MVGNANAQQEASASQSTNNNDGFNNQDNPESLNSSDRGATLPPDYAINESGNLEDSEFEGEENAPKVKKQEQTAAKKATV